MNSESPEASDPDTFVAFEFPVGDPSAVRIPRRIRRRFLEATSGISSPSSVEEINAKLKEADLRRQQFHDLISSKARLNPRSPSRSFQEEDLIHIEAKLTAAEQKRQSSTEQSRKLAKCWRQFVKSRRTTFALAKSYEALQIDEKVAKSMPFEQLALLMESSMTVQAVYALLNRIESRFLLYQSSSSSDPENIDHLLKHLACPSKRKVSKRGSIKELKSHESNKLSRYPVRIVLCAYMILGHPNAVLSGQGEREIALGESAANFIQEFELLIKIILDGNGRDNREQSSAQFPTFRSEISAFDTAWCSYLYCFVAWKVKDARSLEDILVRTACQLELSMLRTCKQTSEGQTCELTHYMMAIPKQVIKDQNLLREKVQHLSGSAGLERMESALSDTRSKYIEAKHHRTHSATPGANISVTSTSSSSMHPLESFSYERSNSESSLPAEVGTRSQELAVQSSNENGKQLPTENEIMVNEIVHGFRSTPASKEGTNIQAKVKETIEKAFWDGIMGSMKEDSHDYSRILGLVKEVRDELRGMVPQNLKQHILDSINIDILSEVFKSGTQDTEYLGEILQFALGMIQKLAAPAKEGEMKKVHQNLLNKLASINQSDGQGNKSSVITIIEGLRFVLEEIQELKKEISKARVEMLEPIIKGSAGLDYLQKAFAGRYGPPPGTPGSLPLTAQWISSLGSSSVEWNEHNDLVSLTSTSHGVPIITALRTGGSVPIAGNSNPVHGTGDEEQPGCTGEKIDLCLRLGVLKLASGIEGLTIETVPETLGMNVLRLRSVQNKLQQAIVISTSMLVLRQILLSENLASSLPVLENIISHSSKRLSKLLDNAQDVGIEEIINSIACSSSETELESHRDMIARVLTKSLQSNDAVFVKVSGAIYLATRAVVLGGSADKGQKLAEAALKRIGASALLDQVVKAAKTLIIVATVSGYVHWPWYKCLV